MLLLCLYLDLNLLYEGKYFKINLLRSLSLVPYVRVIYLEIS